VLLADTAVPVWHNGRHELPWLFGSSAMASAGAAAAIFVDEDAVGPARRVAIGGAVAELALTEMMEHRLGETGEVYKQGEAGKFSKLAKGLTGAGVAMLATKRHKLGGALVCAGSMCMRWSVYKAGFQSARDPKYVIGPQRERANREGTRATTT
jgi:hypothetical protein